MTRDLKRRGSQRLPEAPAALGQHAPGNLLPLARAVGMCCHVELLIFMWVLGIDPGPCACMANTVPTKPPLQPRYYFFDQRAWLKITLQIIKHSTDSQRQDLEQFKRIP